jgi:hypothetical protein
MLLPCADSAALQTEKFYDMLGTGSFAALSLGSLLAAKSTPARKVGIEEQQAPQTGQHKHCRALCIMFAS